MNSKNTAKFRKVPDLNGNRYYFYCDLSGALVCITKPYKSQDSQEELLIAWENEARWQFDKCQKCGKWVSSIMFNADVLECVDCAPWEEKPKFCKHCGEAVVADEDKCTKCGLALRYQGGELSA